MDEELRELERKVREGQDKSVVLVRPYVRAGRFAIEEIEPEQFEPHSKLYNVEGKTIDLYTERSYTIDDIAGFIPLYPRREHTRGKLKADLMHGWFMPSSKTYFSIWNALYDNRQTLFSHQIDFLRETFAFEVSRMQVRTDSETPYSSPVPYWMRSDTLINYKNGSWTCTHYTTNTFRKEKTPFEPSDDFTFDLCQTLFGNSDVEKVKTVLEWMTHHKPAIVNETNQYLNVPKTVAFRVEPTNGRFEVHLRDFRAPGANWHVRFQ